MKQIIKKTVGVAARTYHRVRAARPVWTLLNAKSTVLYRKSKLNFDEKMVEIIKDLKENGIAVTHIDELLPSGAFVELKHYVEKRWSDQDVRNRYDKRHDAFEGDKLKSKSFFLVDLWEGERILNLNHPFTRFSLSHPILGIVNAYMDMYVKFTDWRLQVTVPMPEGMRSYASQEWHRDPEDQQLVKVFLYLNDVDENSGPFIYLKKSHIFGKWRKLFPQQPPRGSAGAEAKIPQVDKIVCTGKAGTIIFCDTSGLHRGGHAKKNNRFMYTSVFQSPASVWPTLYKYPEDFSLDNLQFDQQFAIKNNDKAEPKFYQF